MPRRSVRIPFLFDREPRSVAFRLYERAVFELVFAGRNKEAVAAVRRVRAHVRRAGLGHLGSQYSWEIEALLNLRRPRAAWTQYRRWLRLVPRRYRTGTVAERARSIPPILLHHEVPILYAWGKWADGARALEAYLGMALRKASAWQPTALDLMYEIYNGDPEPTAWPRVTLTHFYAKLGKRLDQWPDWERWVRALHPTLLDIGGVTRRALAADPGLLPGMYRRIADERARRTPSGFSEGQRDLVEPAAKVAARQARSRRKTERYRPTARARAERTRAKLQAYFPFLAG